MRTEYVYLVLTEWSENGGTIMGIFKHRAVAEDYVQEMNEEGIHTDCVIEDHPINTEEVCQPDTAMEEGCRYERAFGDRYDAGD